MLQIFAAEQNSQCEQESRTRAHKNPTKAHVKAQRNGTLKHTNRVRNVNYGLAAHISKQIVLTFPSRVVYILEADAAS